MKQRQRCAYCGGADASTHDHVVPKSLYPPSKSTSRFQRITVDACAACNNSWQDDEAHFRSMLVVCGGSAGVVRELWEGPTLRSFDQPDAHRRVRDIAAQMVPVETPEGSRHKVYPARDPRVMRIVRKVVRGLCHHHGLLSPVLDRQVWADVQRYNIPPDLMDMMVGAHAEKDVLMYSFGVTEEHADMHSCWVLRFFDSVPFFCIVYRFVEARQRMELVSVG